MESAWEAVRRQIDRCIEDFRAGRLTERALQQLAEMVEAARPKRQNLLYIQAANTHPGSAPLGMMLIMDGKCVEPPADPNEWPYKSVLDAMKDGWRVISFPNLALLMDPVQPQSLGCEFILEKWG